MSKVKKMKKHYDDFEKIEAYDGRLRKMKEKQRRVLRKNRGE